jgi:tetratricopeptide (TPR) repeat protein
MDAIDLHLAQLESAGLIRQAEELPELEYLFRHALVQEVAYESLLKADRRRLHLAVGSALEEMYPDRLEELAPLLAQHFHEAGEATSALQYFTLAGDAAYRHYANAEAVGHYTHALHIAHREPVGTSLLINLYTRRGRALELQGHYHTALNNYTEMETLAREHNDRALELAAMLAVTPLYITETPLYDPERGQALCAGALALARRLGDRPAEARVLWHRCLLCHATGRVDEAIAYGEASLAIARALNLRDQVAQTLHDLSYYYLSTGQPARGFAALQEAGRIWREVGNLPMLADNLASHGLRYYLAGEIASAVRFLDEATALCRQIGNRWDEAYSRGIRGMVYLTRGEPGEAIRVLLEADHLAEQTGFRAGSVVICAFLAVIYAGLEAPERAQAAVRRALHGAVQMHAWRPLTLAGRALVLTGAGELAAAETALREARTHIHADDPFTVQMLVLAEGEYGLACQDYARVLTTMEELIPMLRGRGIRLFIADALGYQGRALHAQGRLDAAQDRLSAARAEAEATGTRWSLWPILATLSVIAAERGHADEAAALRQQAAEIVNAIAAHTGSPELRDGFLNKPAVRAVLNETA